MDTTRVDICYRPLRIAWAIRSDDWAAFREAVRLTHTMWGGRFNPVVLVDRPEEARETIEAFRADLIVPIGNGDGAQDFPARFPHLINRMLSRGLFISDRNRPARALVLDMHNALVHWRNTPASKVLTGDTIQLPGWADSDPLADAFLVQLGSYPEAASIGIDYHDILSKVVLAIQLGIDAARPLPAQLLSTPNLNYLSRHGLYRHYTIRNHADYPGVFVGDVTSIGDLVAFWNLRAADIRLQFIDPNHWARYELLLPAYVQSVRESIAHLDEHRRKLAVWARQDRLQKAVDLFAGQPLIGWGIGPGHWLGGMAPPMMVFGEESSLGVGGGDGGTRRVSFALHAKPFCGETWFHTQHLVASVSLLDGDEQHTFLPPYVPEWNEFYSRAMFVQYDRLRIEPERIGLIIDAADHDATLSALSVGGLVEEFFHSIGMTARLSGGGLIARQMIARLGGMLGARVFKIPGVRRLLKTYGPADAFTRNAALQLIGSRDPANPGARFEDHRNLYIESRPIGTLLTPPMVFEYLVEKGLFRIGTELVCPTCHLTSWIALDLLRQTNRCEFCGGEFDATRQLIRGKYHYRRSGVLGLERNAQGAVPVALVLQQLHTNLGGTFDRHLCAASYDLKPKQAGTLPECEVDFLTLIGGHYPEKTKVLLGECKDEGGRIDADDVEHLRQIADALPPNRFEVFIVFAKLAAFTAEEIALVQTLNGPYQNRVILLTARELEPYNIYERTALELGITAYGNSPEELARVTAQVYFTDARPN